MVEIKSIQFGVVSDDYILDISVCEVNKPSLLVEEGSVYDPRLGCVNSGVLCETCDQDMWKCTGHFGHINLNTPIILFYKQVVLMLRLFCFDCYRLLCTKDELDLQGVFGYSKIIEHVSCMLVCGRCGSPHPEVKLDLNEMKITAVLKLKTEKSVRVLCPVAVKCIFDNIPEEEVKVLGVDTTLFQPKFLVLTKFPVIPIHCRPRMVTPDNVSDDDLSVILTEIVKNNNMLNKHVDPVTYTNIINEIKFRTLTFCDNSKNKAVHTTNHKPLTGIKERINKKSGHVRQNLMGKRCNRTARTVLGPEPTLRMNEVGIPQEIANALSVPEIVSTHNIARLTALVNTPGMASLVIKPGGNKISVPFASVKQGTMLHHGDRVRRGCTDIIVTNCKMPLLPGDVITRPDGEIVPLTFPKPRRIVLQLGDVVERRMQDGDYVLLNRQPTLHRNSMQGMKAVIKPGRTIRMNLSVVTGFNADFDGDEGNIFAQETIEARAELEFLSNAKYNILSAQSPKSEIAIVQDSLLGAYLMTKTAVQMSRGEFMQCVMRIDCVYDYNERLLHIREVRKEPGYTSCALWGFVFPDTFAYTETSDDTSHEHESLEIRGGVLLSGAFDKRNLKHIIRHLALDYDSDVAVKFVDNAQFLTNCWLELYPFTVGFKDCRSAGKRSEIQAIVQKYFLEADQVFHTIGHPHIRESRVSSSLNKAKDIGLKIAKSVLGADNNFNSTVASGSKGDYFNIAQITGLLGQQNLDGCRPARTLQNNTRSLVHYPQVIINDPPRRYRSRGFVASSFIEGMKPDEMFFHAMTGRDGMIKTAMETATSGYIQRSIIKMNEDLKIEYDGTVRDARKNIYQFAFGNHGYNPCYVSRVGADVLPMLPQRLASRFQSADDAQNAPLSVAQTQELIDACAVACERGLPRAIMRRIQQTREDSLRRHLRGVVVDRSRFGAFSSVFAAKFHAAQACPGECVGIIGAQSIGERQTQTTLNSFHTAGKLQVVGVSRLDEILNMSKNLKHRTCTVYFKAAYASSRELREALGSSLTQLYFGDLVTTQAVCEREGQAHMSFEFAPSVMFAHQITPYDVALRLKTVSDTADIYIKTAGLEVHLHSEEVAEFTSQLSKLLLCGISGILKTHLDYDAQAKEWFVVTEGSNLARLLAHPLVDGRRIYCSDFWEVYALLGISAVRKMLLGDLYKICAGINIEHLQLLVDKMTHKGKPCSITRYTMRTNDCGPLSKATFEESVDILTAASMKTEVEHNNGISAAVICGNQPRVGTGFVDLLVDLDKLRCCDTAEEDDADDIDDIDPLVYTSYLPS